MPNSVNKVSSYNEPTMRVVVNTSSLPVYKKYRIASLLCIFETSVYLVYFFLLY